MAHEPFRLSAEQALALHRDLDAGFLLPTRWYGDPAIFEAELTEIHQRSWHFAAHMGQLAGAGDVALCTIAKTPVVLVRQADGAVRGFINICRHRGHPVVTEVGNRHAIRCHFHGWTYELDGSLRHAPRSAGEPSFDLARFGLVSVQTHVWGPTVWVNLDLQAPTFESWIDGMPELVAQCGLDVTQHSHAFDHTWDIDSNWKVFQDNTIECYHCPTTHPELSRVLEMKPEKQELFVGGKYWIHHRIPFRDGVNSGMTYQRVEGQPFFYYYHWIFPGTYMQFSGKGFDIGTLNIVAVDKIQFRHLCFLPHDTSAEIKAKGQAQIEADATIWQDVELCNRVQVGHASGLAPQARVLHAPESLLGHLQHLIVDALTEAQSDPARASRPQLQSIASGS